MTGDGDFPKKSRIVPPANSTRNFFQEEVVGNKTDAAVTSAGTTKSLQAYAKGSLTNEATILAAVQAIQNNTRFVAAVPERMQIPVAGDTPYMIACNLYDEIGHMEDPDNNEILVRVYDSTGAYVTATLYQDIALVTPLASATDLVNFPTASGWRAIPKIADGRYLFYYKVSTTSTVEALLFEFGYGEGGHIQSQYRPSYIGDEDTMVADIFADTQAIIALIGVPVTNLATDIAAIGIPDAAGTAALLLSTKNNQTIVWSNVQPLLIIPAVAADLDFPTIHIPAGTIPTGATLKSVRLMLMWRKQVDSSGAANAINGLSKTIRAKKSTGAWGTDDVVGIDMPNNILATDGSATEGGSIIIGNYDIKSEIDVNNIDYHVRSEQTNRMDAILCDATSLTLVDVMTGFIIEWI